MTLAAWAARVPLSGRETGAWLAAGLVALFLSAQALPAESDEERGAPAIAAMKAWHVSRIEPSLPAVPLADWLDRTVGKDFKSAWHWNHCGERAADIGTAGASDLPLCVSYGASFSDREEIVILFTVGTSSTGFSGSPRLHGILLREGGSGVTAPPTLEAMAQRIRALRDAGVLGVDYPWSDAIDDGREIDAPVEFRSGSATRRQMCDWVYSLIHERTQPYLLDADGDDVPEVHFLVPISAGASASFVELLSFRGATHGHAFTGLTTWPVRELHARKPELGYCPEEG